MIIAAGNTEWRLWSTSVLKGFERSVLLIDTEFGYLKITDIFYSRCGDFCCTLLCQMHESVKNTRF